MKEDHVNERGSYIFGQMVVSIASAKSSSTRRVSHHLIFYGQLPYYYPCISSLIYPVNEFFLKEMWTWGQSKIFILLSLSLV